jgi:hypothetical protein
VRKVTDCFMRFEEPQAGMVAAAMMTTAAVGRAIRLALV